MRSPQPQWEAPTRSGSREKREKQLAQNWERQMPNFIALSVIICENTVVYQISANNLLLMLPMILLKSVFKTSWTSPCRKPWIQSLSTATITTMHDQYWMTKIHDVFSENRRAILKDWQRIEQFLVLNSGVFLNENISTHIQFCLLSTQPQIENVVIHKFSKYCGEILFVWDNPSSWVAQAQWTKSWSLMGGSNFSSKSETHRRFQMYCSVPKAVHNREPSWILHILCTETVSFWGETVPVQYIFDTYPAIHPHCRFSLFSAAAGQNRFFVSIVCRLGTEDSAQRQVLLSERSWTDESPRCLSSHINAINDFSSTSTKDFSLIHQSYYMQLFPDIFVDIQFNLGQYIDGNLSMMTCDMPINISQHIPN